MGNSDFPSEKKSTGTLSKVHFPEENWEELRLLPVTTCKAVLRFNMAAPPSTVWWNFYFFLPYTHVRVRLKSTTWSACNSKLNTLKVVFVYEKWTLIETVTSSIYRLCNYECSSERSSQSDSWLKKSENVFSLLNFIVKLLGATFTPFAHILIACSS